jgi:hypothetical protein
MDLERTVGRDLDLGHLREVTAKGEYLALVDGGATDPDLGPIQKRSSRRTVSASTSPSWFANYIGICTRDKA